MSNRFNIVIKNDSVQSWKKEIDTEIKADNEQELNNIRTQMCPKGM